jgi:chromosome segregation ATPase
MMRRFIVSLVFVFIAFSFVPAQSSSPNIMVEYLLKIGKIYYDRGDYISAIHEFTKAVMIDPSNSEAQGYLKKMGAGGGYVRVPERQMIDAINLAGEVERYQKQLEQLTKENEKRGQLAHVLELDKRSLREIISTKETENKNLRAEIEQIQNEFQIKSAQDRDAFQQMEKTSHNKGREVERLNEEIVRLNTRLRVVKETIAFRETENRDLEKKIQDVQREANAKNAQDQALLKDMQLVLDNKAQDIARLNQEKSALNERLAQVKQTMSVKEAENTGLRDKIRKVQLAARLQAEQDSAALKKAEKTITNKEQEIARLNTDLFRLKDEMVAKIALLKEKDYLFRGATAKETAMSQDIQAKERSWQAQSGDYEKEIAKLTRLFERYQDHYARSAEEYQSQVQRLQEVIRKNRLQLASLNDRLIFTQYKLASREEKLGDSNRIIGEMKNSLFMLEKEMADFQDKNIGKNKDMKIVIKNLSQDAEKEKMLKAKDQVIMDLKMKLAKARQEVTTLGKSEERLAALKENLEKIKQELAAYQSQGNKNLDTALLEAQIQDIQQKIKIVEGQMRDKGAVYRMRTEGKT